MESVLATIQEFFAFIIGIIQSFFSLFTGLFGSDDEEDSSAAE